MKYINSHHFVGAHSVRPRGRASAAKLHGRTLFAPTSLHPVMFHISYFIFFLYRDLRNVRLRHTKKLPCHKGSFSHTR